VTAAEFNDLIAELRAVDGQMKKSWTTDLRMQPTAKLARRRLSRCGARYT